MLLRNLNVIDDSSIIDLRITDGKIDIAGNIADTAAGELVVCFDDVIAFPGLINSHDHLDFNLFPKLGNKLHGNYVEWSNYIHTHHKDVISKVLHIPKELRVKWGVYKNLINGITTVVNHGPRLHIDDEIITVFQQYHLLHSIQLEKHWKYLLNKPFKKKWPFVIHIGEGEDASSHNEIDYLKKWNLYNRDIIGVHGIAMTELQASYFNALVWCPDSNFFLIGKTASIKELKQRTNILFGTDSTLSAGWNLWDHLRLARSQKSVSDKELYNMLTITPAKIWGLKECGKIMKGNDADIVIAKRKGNLHGLNAYYLLNPEDILLILHKGQIRLFDELLLNQIDNGDGLIKRFSKIVINGALKYIYGDVPGLMKQIKSYYKDASFPIESIKT